MKFLSNKFIFLFLSAAFAIYPSIYETTNSRKLFFAEWKAAAGSSGKSLIQRKITEDDGSKTGLIIKYEAESIDVMFYPAYRGWDDFKTYGRIIYRFDLSGQLSMVKVHFLENNDSYLLFKGNGKYDIYLLGKKFREDLRFFGEIDRLKYISLNSILGVLKENKIDTEILLPVDDYVMKNKFTLAVITKSLLPYSKDGAINEFDEYVNIADLSPQVNGKGVNCSGFLKEITDNYIKFLNPSEKRLSISPLKEKNYTGNATSREIYKRYDKDEDPFFGLDWTYNLITVLNNKCGYKVIKAEEIRNDSYASYFKDRGFYLEDLSGVIFRDQQRDPPFVYFIVFNKYTDVPPFVPKYYHSAVIVPYTSGKHFYMRVFESGEETGYTNIIKNQLPAYFSKDTFEKYLLDKKITEDDDKKLLKKNYILSKNRSGYNLNYKIESDEAVRISKIFDRIEYKDIKVMIYKIPIPYQFFDKE